MRLQDDNNLRDWVMMDRRAGGLIVDDARAVG
jgi:hypothetical protein